jgi:signal transduction histidine kinase
MGPLLSSAINYIEALKADAPHTVTNVLHEDLTEIQNLLDEAILKIRTSAHNLMPVYLMNNGLEKALETLCNQLNTHEQISVTFTHQHFPQQLSNWAIMNIYRIIQELCNNTFRHAEARNLWIDIKTNNGEKVQITIKDDGIGFNIKEQSKTGIGMKSIHNRVKLFKGNIVMKSSPGKGVNTLITFDYKQLI